MKRKVPVMLASIPFITLIIAIPLVNRLEPMIWGLPFLLWWLLINITLTPVWLFMAFRYEKSIAGAVGADLERKEGV